MSSFVKGMLIVVALGGALAGCSSSDSGSGSGGGSPVSVEGLVVTIKPSQGNEQICTKIFQSVAALKKSATGDPGAFATFKQLHADMAKRTIAIADAIAAMGH